MPTYPIVNTLDDIVPSINPFLRSTHSIHLTPDQFINRLLEWDAEPPSDEYSHADFVASVVRDVPDVLSFAASAVASLPATLALDVLEAIYDVRPESVSYDVAVDWLTIGPYLRSAAVVVEIMISRLHVPPDDMLDFLFSRIANDRDESSVDQLAYACWWIVNGATLLIADDKTVGCLVTPDHRQLEALIALPHLSDYARTALAACKGSGAQQ